MKYIALLIIIYFSSFANAAGVTYGLPLPGLPKSLGPKTMSQSTSVTFATDQTPLAVTFSSASSQVVTQGTTPWIVGGSVGITNTPTVNQGTTPWIISGTATTSQAPNSNGSQATVSVTIAESTFSSPTNSIGLIIEAESGNATNIRWGISNTATSFLSSTIGQLSEPGRDSGFIPAGQGTVLHLISTGVGTNKAGIQWVMSQ